MLLSARLARLVRAEMTKQAVLRIKVNLDSRISRAEVIKLVKMLVLHL